MLFAYQIRQRQFRYFQLLTKKCYLGKGNASVTQLTINDPPCRHFAAGEIAGAKAAQIFQLPQPAYSNSPSLPKIRVVV
jgi:hypothetical protein